MFNSLDCGNKGGADKQVGLVIKYSIQSFVDNPANHRTAPVGIIN